MAVLADPTIIQLGNQQVTMIMIIRRSKYHMWAHWAGFDIPTIKKYRNNIPDIVYARMQMSDIGLRRSLAVIQFFLQTRSAETFEHLEYHMYKCLVYKEGSG